MDTNPAAGLDAVAAAPGFHPDITVACVVERDGRFLLVEERVRGELVLNQPAGHVETGESLLDAAVRETLEETRWEVELSGLIGVYQWRAPDDTHFLRFAFRALPRRELAQRGLDHGIERVLWLSHAELRAAEARLRSPLVLRAVEDALAAPHAPLALLRQVG
jgi:8-oxo-dGTP pyrophosphatase MutT (NUDIX family)